jgi:hypothetical protein
LAYIFVALISVYNLNSHKPYTLHTFVIYKHIYCWLPTATNQVQARVRSCEICGEQGGTGTGFLQVLHLPSPLIPSTGPCLSPSSIILGWYNRPGQCDKLIKSQPTPRSYISIYSSPSQTINNSTLVELLQHRSNMNTKILLALRS